MFCGMLDVAATGTVGSSGVGSAGVVAAAACGPLGMESPGFCPARGSAPWATRAWDSKSQVVSATVRSNAARPPGTALAPA